MALPAGSNKAIGFLTVVEHDLHGLFGGYLLLNETGRPLEFHCTAPVKPNRAQQILYGPTLKPFLYGEQIGATLVNKPTLVPLAVLVDRPAALAARPFIQVPMAIVLGGATDPAAVSNAAGEWLELAVGQNRLAISRQHPADLEEIAQRFATIGAPFDFIEPFDRIRDAIDEAQRTGARAA
jgi:hypothetical protein